ncbi:MAG TPA: terminase TerL endonuclease subunit [Methylophilaceae bacterium]|nr:terminase TerL endonuclease subunit [Methylophilaceae bacterium]
MPHIKGDWAQRSELIILERWEVFVLAVSFGWIVKATGKRRFRIIDLFVPRKNAKSTIAAVIGLYMLACDGEFGAEVYSGATSKDQAMEVFRPARLMAIATPEYRSLYSVIPNISNLAIQGNNSKFEPIIGKPGDGASPSCAIVDEYHEHATDELYETMQSGMGARSQPIMLTITTSGVNISGPCYQHQVQLQKVLENTEPNDQRFGIIFTIDIEDDWTSEIALRKANPNFDISISGEYLLAQLQAALVDPRKQATFKTKHLNIWVASASPWIDVEKLQLCGDAGSLDDFVGETCTIGNDLASKLDIASVILEFTKFIAGKKHYYVFSRNYIPEAMVNKPENGHYRGWVAQGYLTVTQGNMINLRQIEEETAVAAERFVVNEIAMDAWGAREMAPNLQELGYTVIDVPMITKYLSEPMKDIQALIADGRFHHDGNLAYIWMMSNVEIKPDRNDNIFPRKNSDEKKIDAAVATIVGHSRAMLGIQHEVKSFWETESA